MILLELEGGAVMASLHQRRRKTKARSRRTWRGRLKPGPASLTKRSSVWRSYKVRKSLLGLSADWRSRVTTAGMLLNYKKSPLAAVEKMGEWVAKERRARAVRNKRRQRHIAEVNPRRR